MILEHLWNPHHYPAESVADQFPWREIAVRLAALLAHSWRWPWETSSQPAGRRRGSLVGSCCRVILFVLHPKLSLWCYSRRCSVSLAGRCKDGGSWGAAIDTLFNDSLVVISRYHWWWWTFWIWLTGGGNSNIFYFHTIQLVVEDFQFDYLIFFSILVG